MNKLLLLIILFYGSLSVFSQETCSDIIYLPDGQSMIFKCCVQKIEDGNLVYFSRAGEQDTVRAMAVNVDGNNIALSVQANDSIPAVVRPAVSEMSEQKHDYHYYEREFEKATLQKHIGIVLTFLGAFSEVTGYIFLMSNTSEEYKQPMGAILFVGGIVMESVGIPLWISGGIKRANNRKAMETLRQQGLSLKLAPHGLGMVYRF